MIDCSFTRSFGRLATNQTLYNIHTYNTDFEDENK